MFKLPQCEYTSVIEFFPTSMAEVTMSVVSTSFNIGQQSTKLFPKTAEMMQAVQGVGHLFVYGIEGKQQSDVSSAVYA